MENTYTDYFCNTYFRRTTTQQEIDCVEDAGGRLHAFECKWQAGKPARFPKSFLDRYPGSETEVIDREGFLGLG